MLIISRLIGKQLHPGLRLSKNNAIYNAKCPPYRFIVVQRAFLFHSLMALVEAAQYGVFSVLRKTVTFNKIVSGKKNNH